MSIHLRTHAKNKSVLISGIISIAFAGYRYLDLWGNLSFFVERLQDGTVKSVLGFFATERGANALFFFAIAFFVLALLFEVRRTKPDEDNEKHPRGTAGRDLTTGSEAPPAVPPQPDKEAESAPAITRPEPTETNVVPPLRTSDDGRVIVHITPEELINYFREHTTAQAQKLVGVYLGKWMRVAGPVSDIDNAGIVFIRHENTNKAILLEFNEAKWVERISVLRLGDEVAVLGQLQYISGIGIRLENCELLDSRPRPSVKE
jgi:hypothetical protein